MSSSFAKKTAKAEEISADTRRIHSIQIWPDEDVLGDGLTCFLGCSKEKDGD